VQEKAFPEYKNQLPLKRTKPMTLLNKISLIPLVLTGALFLTRCSGDGSARKGEKDLISQQNKAELILTSRTMGLAFLEENKLEEAENEFLKLIALAPKEANGYANLGLVYLSMGRYDKAEQSLLKALDITPGDPDIRMNLATVYKYTNNDGKFVEELEKTIEADPDHVQSIYRLAEFYSGTGDPATMQKREAYLNQVLEIAPANIVPRLNLIELLLNMDKGAEALWQLEEVARIFPDLPDEAGAYYDLAFNAIKAKKIEEALTASMIFHNFMKLTGPYNQGMTMLKGFEGTSLGSPMFTFSEAAPLFMSEGESILDAMQFTDVTESAGLASFNPAEGNPLESEKEDATHIALGDFDHDGSDDIYLGTYLAGKEEYSHFMLMSEMGRFKDITSSYGLRHHGKESQASFTDFDNDGWFDLLVISEGEPVLYKSVREGTYEDVSKKAFSGKVRNAIHCLYVDMDQEGDLDLYISTRDKQVMLRNNGDGTFTDYTEYSGLGDPLTGSEEALFGDFDDDGDIDLMTRNHDGSCGLFSNMREGKFSQITQASGLSQISHAHAITTGDYNNDGLLDVFVAGSGSRSFRWLANTGTGTFKSTTSPGPDLRAQDGFSALDAEFVDFDNDGYLDLFIVGIPGKQDTRGGILMHNNGEGGFEDVSHLLPE